MKWPWSRRGLEPAGGRTTVSGCDVVAGKEDIIMIDFVDEDGDVVIAFAASAVVALKLADDIRSAVALKTK